MTLTKPEFMSLVDLFTGNISAFFEMLDTWQLYEGFTLFHLFLGSAFLSITIHLYKRLTVPRLQEDPTA